MMHSKEHSNILKITLVLQIKRVKVSMQVLPFEMLVPIEVIKLIKTLNVKRVSQKTDVPTKIVKLNADFFSYVKT